MAVKRKAKLDPLNVFYGIGAAILLVGAMFKFLNMEGANEMLFIGLATEAIVFVVSGFELRQQRNEYQWEKIFPQLAREDESPIQRLDEIINKVNLDPQIVEKLTRSIEHLESNVAQMTSMTYSTELSEHIDRMKEASENFEQEITKLNSSIAEMNRYYEKMLNVMTRRREV